MPTLPVCQYSIHLPRFHSLKDSFTAPNAVIVRCSYSCYPALTSGQQPGRVPWQEFPSPSFFVSWSNLENSRRLDCPGNNGLCCKSTTAAAQQQRHPRQSMARSSGRRKEATASGGGGSSSNSSSSTRKDAAEAAPRKMRLRRRPALADISAAVGNNQGGGAAAGAGAGSKPGARKTVRCQACCWVGCNTLARHRIALGHGKVCTCLVCFANCCSAAAVKTCFSSVRRSNIFEIVFISNFRNGGRRRASLSLSPLMRARLPQQQILDPLSALTPFCCRLSLPYTRSESEKHRTAG